MRSLGVISAIVLLLVGGWCVASQAQVSGTGADSNKTYAVPALSPKTIFGGDLVAWYRCDAGVTSSGMNVTGWADQSSYHHDMVNTFGGFLTYGATSFNGKCGISAPDFPTGLYLSTQPFNINRILASFFMVLSVGSCNQGTIFFAYDTNVGPFGDPSGFMLRGTLNGLIPAWYQANFSNSPFANFISFDTAYRWGFVYNGSTVTGFTNNVEDSRGDLAASGYNVLGGGGELFHLGGGGSCGFTTPEIVMTRSVASTPQRTALDSYFRAKWGL